VPRAPRIDTTRNRLEATRELLTMILDELDDLHCLAYERATATRDAPVRGGDHDYALDTHGDQRARAAYTDLATKTIGACTTLAEASHNAIALLREGRAPGPRMRRLIDTDELVQALAAQARRADRGDYTPHRSHVQPEVAGVKHTIDRIIRERDDALRLVDRLTRRLAKHEPVQTTRGRRRRRRSA
jgi:hypothetical protein